MKTSFASLEQRIANQTRRINQGVRAGTLTQDEASGLRSRLNRTQRLIENDAFDGNGASRLEQQQRMLNGIGRDIRAGKRNETIDPAQRTANITRRIERGLADGSLTQQEYDALKARLGSAQTPEQLKQLSRDVRAERHDGEMDAQKRVASFNERIQRGVADGSLTPDEARALTDRVNGLGATPTAEQVNSLSRDIFTQRHDRQMDNTKAIESVAARIGELEASGKLTADQASAYRAQLEELKRPDAQAVSARLNVLRQQLQSHA